VSHHFRVPVSVSPSDSTFATHPTTAMGREGISCRVYAQEKEMMNMVRKFCAAVVALMLAVGGLFAEDIKGIFKKFEDGKLTITVDDKDKEFKVDKDAMQKQKKKDVLVSDVLKNFKEGDKGIFTVEDNKVTKVKKNKGK
jgi:hypothetical protein